MDAPRGFDTRCPGKRKLCHAFGEKRIDIPDSRVFCANGNLPGAWGGFGRVLVLQPVDAGVLRDVEGFHKTILSIADTLIVTAICYRRYRNASLTQRMGAGSNTLARKAGAFSSSGSNPGALKLLPDEENAPEISHTRIPDIALLLVTASPR